MKEQYIIDYNITCSYLFGDEKPHIIRVKWVRLAGDYFCEEVFLDEVSMEVTEDVKFWPVAHLVVNR